MSEEDIQRELRRLTRRGFITGAVAAGVGFGAYKFLRTRPPEEGVAWPFRKMLRINESIARGYFSEHRLSPTFRRSDITAPRINGHQGLSPEVDAASWRITIEGAAAPISLTLDDVKSLPHHEQITELRCIEGWSVINKWTGVRLGDLIAKYPPPSPVSYVALETPGRGYYVGLDIDSALHPQTLLAWMINDQPLSWHHGAPLRLAIPVKYGIKNIKRIATIRYTNVRPADFWGERGYDWYAGH